MRSSAARRRTKPNIGRMPAGVSRSVQQVLGVLKGAAVEVQGAQPFVHVVAVLNPLTRAAQRVSGVQALAVDMTIKLSGEVEAWFEDSAAASEGE